MQECAGECRNRASSMKSTEDFWSKKKFADHSTSTTGATTMAARPSGPTWFILDQSFLDMLVTCQPR